MSIFPLGRQRVGVELDLPVLDGGQPTFTEFHEPITAPTLVWVDNARFDVRMVTEERNLTVTTDEVALAQLPVADSMIPAVDDNNNPAPIPFFNTTGTPTISSAAWLHHNGLRYSMIGDAVLEQDRRGRQNHVRCECQRQRG